MTTKKTVVLLARAGADQAQFLVDKVADKIFVHAAPGIANHSNRERGRPAACDQSTCIPRSPVPGVS